VATTLTVLCDNCVAQSGLIGEHGFSVLIERSDATCLFDTGPGRSLPHNAAALKKDLSRVDMILVSHGHYDHTGGLEWAVRQAAPVDVVAHPEVFSRHMIRESPDAAEAPRYIGCPTSRETLEAAGATFRFASATAAVAPGLRFVTGVRQRPGQTALDTRLVCDPPFGERPAVDPVADDASLLIEGDHAPILVLGCAHAGLLNILDHVDDLGVTRLEAVVGGTHLMFSGAELLTATIRRLEDFSVRQVAVCHCTGFDAAAKLAAHFGQRFSRASVGSVYRFGRPS